jgi:hypothetical protein
MRRTRRVARGALPRASPPSFTQRVGVRSSGVMGDQAVAAPRPARPSRPCCPSCPFLLHLIRIAVVSQAWCPTPSRSLTPVPNVSARRSAGAPCPLHLQREPFRNPCARSSQLVGPFQQDSPRRTRRARRPSRRDAGARSPVPRARTPSPHERSVSNGGPTCRSPLRVLCFFVSFVLFVVRSGSPVRRPGLDEQDRRRRAAGFLSQRTRRARRPQREASSSPRQPGRKESRVPGRFCCVDWHSLFHS